MRTLLSLTLLLLILCSPARFGQSPMPDGAILSASLNTSLNTGKLKTGQEVSARITWGVFNVLNQVRFNAQGVGSAVTSIEQPQTQFGTYSSLLTQPRVMQFALRYEF
jgi:hypothetical protein